jgi:hypothetical protein
MYPRSDGKQQAQVRGLRHHIQTHRKFPICQIGQSKNRSDSGSEKSETEVIGEYEKSDSFGLETSPSSIEISGVPWDGIARRVRGMTAAVYESTMWPCA